MRGKVYWMLGFFRHGENPCVTMLVGAAEVCDKSDRFVLGEAFRRREGVFRGVYLHGRTFCTDMVLSLQGKTSARVQQSNIAASQGATTNSSNRAVCLQGVFFFSQVHPLTLTTCCTQCIVSTRVFMCCLDWVVGPDRMANEKGRT